MGAKDIDVFNIDQIESPSTSKNLENCDRDSEEWEGLSNKESTNIKPSPINQNTKGAKLNTKVKTITTTKRK